MADKTFCCNRFTAANTDKFNPELVGKFNFKARVLHVKLFSTISYLNNNLNIG